MHDAMAQREIDFIEPETAASRLRALGGLAFLDSALRHETLGRFSYVMADPFARFTVDAGGARLDGRPLPGPPLAALSDLLKRHSRETIEGLPPFQGGACGLFGYDFAHHLERLDAPADLEPDRPTVSLGFYDTLVAFDLQARRAFLISTGDPEQAADARARRAETRMATVLQHLSRPEPAPAPLPKGGLDWRSNFFAPAYHAAIERVREYIRAGDIYQANIAQTFEAALPAGFDPVALYLHLRRTNPAPFAAFLEDGGRALASSSPERFLKLEGRIVETRPIKGTAKRAADPGKDRALAEALLASEKDRAENVMIVDLLRNDISRVCEADSVEVPVLCGLETYASVHHLVSVVTGRLNAGLDATDLIAATFPGGSITGAPKIRAMDIVTEIERTARGAYCGSIGYLGFDGAMDTNIAIRTVTMENGRARLSAGGGITILSDPASEYEETFTKATRVFAAFSGEEP